MSVVTHGAATNVRSSCRCSFAYVNKICHFFLVLLSLPLHNEAPHTLRVNCTQYSLISIFPYVFSLSFLIFSLYLPISFLLISIWKQRRRGNASQRFPNSKCYISSEFCALCSLESNDSARHRVHILLEMKQG